MFCLSRAHDIISQSENTECCLKLVDSRNDINILLYVNAECRYFGTKVYLHCWILTHFHHHFNVTVVSNF